MLASLCPFRLTLLAFDIHMVLVCVYVCVCVYLVRGSGGLFKRGGKATKSILGSDVQPADLPLSPPSAPQVNPPTTTKHTRTVLGACELSSCFRMH